MKDRITIGDESRQDRECGRTDVEGNLNRSGAFPVQTLHHYRCATQSHRFRKAKFQHAQQQKQEIHRHRARYAGQVHFQS